MYDMSVYARRLLCACCHVPFVWTVLGDVDLHALCYWSVWCLLCDSSDLLWQSNHISGRLLLLLVPITWQCITLNGSLSLPILLHVHTRLCSESANLLQGQNLNQKWSGIRIRISGLIHIWVQMSVGSLPKCSGFILLFSSVTSPSVVKIGWWLCEKC